MSASEIEILRAKAAAMVAFVDCVQLAGHPTLAEPWEFRTVRDGLFVDVLTRPTELDALRDGIEAMEKAMVPVAAPSSGWISVKDALPELLAVVAFTYDGIVKCGYWDGKYWEHMSGYTFACRMATATNVTHWFKVPPPPKGDV